MNKIIITAIALLWSTLSFAGGGGTDHYTCGSKKLGVNFEFEGHLNNIWFFKGKNILVWQSNQTSLYSVESFFASAQVTSFQMSPLANQPNFGKIKIEFFGESSQKDIKITIESTGSPIASDDVSCQWLG